MTILADMPQEPLTMFIFIAASFLGLMFGVFILSREDELKKRLEKYSEKTRRQIYQGVVALSVFAVIGLLFLFIFLEKFGFSEWINLLLRILMIAIIAAFGTVALAHSHD